MAPKKFISFIGAIIICAAVSGCLNASQKAKPNAAELDSVSSWTSSITTKVVQDLKNQTNTTPAQIFTKASTVKNSFADGDAGVVKQTLRGAQVTFTLNQTSISQYVYLDDSMEISTSKLVKSTSPQPIVGCFAAALKNDRYYLHIVQQLGNKVSGQISIRNANKDASYGDFSGTFDGTTLTGMYTFNSEGLQSKRELFFRATESGFLAGFGPVEEVGDTAKFVRPLSITWDHSYIYTVESNCAK